MGLNLGKILKKVVRSVAKRAPMIAGTALGVPGAQAALGQSVQTSFLRSLQPRSVGSGVPAIMGTTAAQMYPRMRTSFQRFNGEYAGEVVPAAGSVPAVAMGMSRAVVGAIVRLAASLGVAVHAGNIGRVGLRLWRSVMAMARRHPGISIVTFLTGLGLVAEEASEFLWWGQAKSKRRRGRGISARDIRVARRTIRKISAFQRDLGRLPHHHRPWGRGRRDGVSVVRAG